MRNQAEPLDDRIEQLLRDVAKLKEDYEILKGRVDTLYTRGTPDFGRH